MPRTQVICDAKLLTKIAIEQGVGVMELSRRAGISITAASRVFQGKPVMIKTANKVFQAFQRDGRIKVWTEATNSKN